MNSAPIAFDRSSRSSATTDGVPRPRMPRVMDLATIMAERHPVQPPPRRDLVRYEAPADASRQVFTAAPAIARRDRRTLRDARLQPMARMGVRVAMAACAIAAVVVIPYVMTHLGQTERAAVQEAQGTKAPTEVQTGRSVAEPRQPASPPRQP